MALSARVKANYKCVSGNDGIFLLTWKACGAELGVLCNSKLAPLKPELPGKFAQKEVVDLQADHGGHAGKRIQPSAASKRPVSPLA
jgi:hypothetical protein